MVGPFPFAFALAEVAGQQPAPIRTTAAADAARPATTRVGVQAARGIDLPRSPVDKALLA